MGSEASAYTDSLDRFLFRMSYWLPFLNPRGYIAKQELAGYGKILDVGCGNGAGSPVAIRPRHENDSCVGLDAFRPYLAQALKEGPYRAILIGGVSRLPLRDQSFEVVLALDVIEHLERNEGLRLLDEVERVATRRVVVLTPNGFLPQSGYDDNVLQAHRSGWTALDFEGRGYRVLGMYGLKQWRGELGKCRFKPKAIGLLLSYVSQLVTKHDPEKAYYLLAVKDLS